LIHFSAFPPPSAANQIVEPGRKPAARRRFRMPPSVANLDQLSGECLNIFGLHHPPLPAPAPPQEKPRGDEITGQPHAIRLQPAAARIPRKAKDKRRRPPLDTGCGSASSGTTTQIADVVGEIGTFDRRVDHFAASPIAPAKNQLPIGLCPSLENFECLNQPNMVLSGML